MKPEIYLISKMEKEGRITPEHANELRAISLCSEFESLSGGKNITKIYSNQKMEVL
jgi:hypothetical protein